ncbi:Uncharacterized protein TCM_036514 [Theobroma cacao]|uniref:Uncharacterized protein n=1 Tax=Theobroma cacao TaxID=3641 RepID=A0A061FL06_THECC|nr:Uncharacterized protein TCM_036514 [Theobroma cacao]
MKQGRALDTRWMDFPKLYGPVQSPKAGSREHEEEGEMFGVILSRSRSVSFAPTLALRAEKENSALENAARRAFSMRRSTSVPSGYYKLFDHRDPFADNEMHVARKSRKRRGKIFEACRRLIGRVLA